MKVSLRLLGFMIASAFFNYWTTAVDYNRMQKCDKDGWFCRSHSDGYEVTYKCPPSNPSTRVWIWSEKFPPQTTSFKIEGCDYVELHTDCPMRNRSYDLKAFHVVDVNYLEFLPIGTEDEFSKENGPSVLFPWKIHIENVSRITSREKLFGETLEGCQNMGEPFSILSLANVSLDRLPSHLLKVRQPIHHVIFDKIVTSFENIDAIYFKTNHVTVTRSNFSVLPPKGIFFEGRGAMKFHNNTFGKIEPGGLTIRSNHFEFTRNQVEEINFKGLDVLGFKIQIGENKILNLNTRAFENVGFSYLPDKFEKASRFSYNFSGNSIENLDPGSLHPDWSDLFNTCSEVIFENNQFDCSCMNLGWTKSFSGLGRKISTFKQFYDLYLSSENNYCSGYNCSLTYVLNNMVDICSEKVSVSSICKPQEI